MFTVEPRCATISHNRLPPLSNHFSKNTKMFQFKSLKPLVSDRDHFNAGDLNFSIAFNLWEHSAIFRCHYALRIKCYNTTPKQRDLLIK